MAADGNRLTVLLVEDERSIAEPFASALTREGFEVVIAPTAREAMELFHRHSPGLVLLDVGLPDGDGREVCRVLRSESPVPIIMLTARGTETDRIVGLELGADDYVVKPFSSAEVVARIRAVLRRTGRLGAEPGPQAAVEIDGLVVEPAARRAMLDGVEIDLTRKEFDLLARLVRDAGSIVTREDLMADVWDENWFGSTKTLDVHVGLLRRKLRDDPATPRFVHTVRGIGFRFSGQGAGEP